MTSISAITYREATQNDIPEVAKLILDLCEFLGEPYFVEDVCKSIDNYFLNPIHRCFVAEKSGKIIGTIGFFIAPELGNHKKVIAHEQYAYVMPEHRGAGLWLIKYIEKNLEMCDIQYGVASPQLQRLLELLNYKPIKTIYRKELLCVEAGVEY